MATAQALVEEALAHHRAGKLDFADALYRRALDLEQDNLNALHLLGSLSCNTGHAEEAVRLLERAQALVRASGNESAQHAALYCNLGHAQSAVGRNADAAATYRHGLALDPAMPELHAGLAASLTKAGDFAGASSEYEIAMHLQSGRPDWLHNLGSSYAAMGDTEKAVMLYRRALVLEPKRPATLRALAVARPDDALAPLAQLAAEQPGDASVHSALGTAQFAAKQFDEALASFARVLALRPGDAEAYWLIGSIHYGRANLDDAEAAYRAALRLSPKLPGALFNLGLMLHRDREKPAEAIALFEALIAVDPNHAEVHYALANAFRSLDRLDKAIESYRVYLERVPNSAIAHLLLAQSLTDSGEKEQAAGHFEKGATLTPNRALPHLAEIGFANTLVDLGRTEEGFAHFRRALALEPLVTHKAVKADADFSVLLVHSPGAYNTPYEYLIERVDFDAHVLILLRATEYDVEFLASRCDVVVNLVSDADNDNGMLPAAASLIDRLGKPVINHPDKIAATDRAAIARLLCGLPDCRVAKVRRFAGSALLSPDFLTLPLAPSFPFLARLAGRHGGDEFEMIETAADLQNLVARHPSGDYYLIEYLDYRSADGFFRKYRFFFVGEEILPYHLAIAAEWKVHHVHTDMANQPWMQREEEAFLGAPERVFEPRHFAALRAIRAAVGLEFFGVDCALDRDGNLVVFEVNATMLVHDNNHTFPYKTPYVRRIKAAFARLLARTVWRVPA